MSGYSTSSKIDTEQVSSVDQDEVQLVIYNHARAGRNLAEL
jgi:hypothetical protein